MAKRETVEEAKKTLSQVNHILATEPLTADQRKGFELHAAKLAGVVSHPWLPVSWSRRIMLGIVLFGLQQALWSGNYEPFLWWLLLPFFSPRIVGECAYLLGRIASLFRPSPKV